LPIIGEILSDCAISFNPDNAEDLGQKIAHLVTNPAVSIDLSLKAKQKVLNYTWEKRAEHIIDFLRSN
jgi:glycosyltransferase involved in cell wall biosynthesis